MSSFRACIADLRKTISSPNKQQHVGARRAGDNVVRLEPSYRPPRPQRNVQCPQRHANALNAMSNALNAIPNALNAMPNALNAMPNAMPNTMINAMPNTKPNTMINNAGEAGGNKHQIVQSCRPPA